MEPLKLDDLRILAQARLEEMTWAYYSGGAGDEVTLRENRLAWNELDLHYHVLRDVSRRRLATSVLGDVIALPVLAAPTAFQRLAHDEGELATVRAVGDAGTIMILSSLATTRIEDVIDEASGSVWFQLYVYRDRGLTQALVERAESAGARAIVLTVDAPVLGRRERDERLRFHLPDGIEAMNVVPAGYGELPEGALGSGLAAHFSELIDPSLSWADLKWLQQITSLPIVVKGVVRPDDARRAIDAGAAAVIVSNHGGRQLDGAPATARVLANVVDAVDGRGEVYVDGGIRRGTDVIKALALGAQAVLLGRPILWGLAWRGEEGVGKALDMLRWEIDHALALCGVADVRELTRDLVGG